MDLIGHDARAVGSVQPQILDEGGVFLVGVGTVEFSDSDFTHATSSARTSSAYPSVTLVWGGSGRTRAVPEVFASRNAGDGASSGTTRKRSTRIFHTAHAMPTDCSRRREEADPLRHALHPPPHVGGHEVGEISGSTSAAPVKVENATTLMMQRNKVRIAQDTGEHARVVYLFVCSEALCASHSQGISPDEDNPQD